MDAQIRNQLEGFMNVFGITKAELARDLGVTRQAVGQLLSGDRGKIPESLTDALDVLGLGLEVTISDKSKVHDRLLSVELEKMEDQVFEWAYEKALEASEEGIKPFEESWKNEAVIAVRESGYNEDDEGWDHFVGSEFSNRALAWVDQESQRLSAKRLEELKKELSKKISEQLNEYEKRRNEVKKLPS
jgi:transcriptional regulator with XRE-family HTH domain